MPDLTPQPADPFDLLVANVLALRAQGCWSSRALAEQAGVSRRSVMSLERAHSTISLRIVDRLARALGVKTGSLFGKRYIARDEADGLIELLLAQNLIAARKKVAFTQDKLSEQSGVSRAVIAHIERQARNPKLLTLAKLATALNLSLESLLSDARSAP